MVARCLKPGRGAAGEGMAKCSVANRRVVVVLVAVGRPGADLGRRRDRGDGF